jgi:SAM-dependent methyltransferase
MKLKHLESCLSSLPNRIFPNPKVELEQYPTSVHLTSSIILSALAKGDAGPGSSVLDLGCGTGILGLGFALVQSDIVYLVDCDPDALELARENVDVLLEEELIGRSEDEEGCIGVELIMAKVKFNLKRKGSKGRGGRGNHNGRDKKGNGRGKKCCPTTVQDNYVHDCDLTDDVNDGIPLSSKIVDTVITK